jgi:anti-anti-sigma factor
MMVSQAARHWLEAEQIGRVTVVTFTQRELLEEAIIQAVGEQLLALVEDHNCPRLILNLSTVKRLSTMVLGKLIALHNRVRTAGGRLALCGINPEIRGIFEILNLTRLLPIYVEEQEALQTF